MAEELEATLGKGDVVIFSYGGCPYCRKVTQAFKAKNVPFLEVDYDELDGASYPTVLGSRALCGCFSGCGTVLVSQC